MGYIYDIYDWPINGIPGEFFLGEDSWQEGYEEERWKMSEIPYLWVSNEGRFYSTYSKRFYNPTHGDDHGHKAIKIRVNGNTYFMYAHRLLAIAFIPNPKKYPIVRHLDDDPDNNELDNLAWGTQLHNHLDAVRNGGYRPITDADREKSYEMSRQPVKLVNIKNENELYFKSLSEAARFIGAQQANLWKVINGKRFQTVGYTGVAISKEEYYAHAN